MTAKKRVQDRRAILEQKRAEQRRIERRRNILYIGLSVVISVALLAGATWGVLSERRADAAAAKAAAAPIEGVKTYEVPSRNHVETPMSYPQTPSVGGDHSAKWADCTGTVYDEPQAAEQVTHSMEHGAVWVTYQPALPADQVSALRKLVDGTPYTLMSPFQGQPAPIMASAWGNQFSAAGPEDPKLAAFITQFRQGKQTPEPGATCSAR